MWALCASSHSKSVSEEKGDRPGADSVSADSAGRGWAGPGGGWHAWVREARQDPHSFGILAGAGGAMK